MRIPLADLGTLGRIARRTRILGLAAALAAVAAAVTAVAVATGLGGERSAYLPQGSSGIVVLDVSASISSDTYGRIRATLDRLAGSDGRYGLILVSDTAYEALPPGTPARELRAFERFFRIPAAAAPGELPQPPRSPWVDAFSAGTRLSTGLRVARDVVVRERLVDPAVLLVSDLDDDTSDLESLTNAALGLRRAGATLRVVSLDASPEDERFMRRLVARSADVVAARLTSESGSDGSGGDVPRSLAVLAVLLAVALAALLGLTERLRWRAA